MYTSTCPIWKQVSFFFSMQNPQHEFEHDEMIPADRGIRTDAWYGQWIEVEIEGPMSPVSFLF